MIAINGVAEELARKTTLSRLLEARGFNTQRVAVERNGQIVPKTSFDTLYIEDGDTLEIVGFVGGG